MRFVGQKKVFLTRSEAAKVEQLYAVGRNSNLGPIVLSPKLANERKVS